MRFALPARADVAVHRAEHLDRFTRSSGPVAAVLRHLRASTVRATRSGRDQCAATETSTTHVELAFPQNPRTTTVKSRMLRGRMIGLGARRAMTTSEDDALLGSRLSRPGKEISSEAERETTRLGGSQSPGALPPIQRVARTVANQSSRTVDTQRSTSRPIERTGPIATRSCGPTRTHRADRLIELGVADHVIPVAALAARLERTPVQGESCPPRQPMPGTS